MKLSRVGLRRLIESVVNEETKSGLTQDSEIRAAVQNILNQCDTNTIEFAYQKDKSKKDSKSSDKKNNVPKDANKKPDDAMENVDEAAENKIVTEDNQAKNTNKETKDE